MLIDRSAAIVSVLMVTLALTAIKDASAFDVPQRSLGVHGPFEVNLATVAAGGFLKIGTTPGDSPPDTWAGVGLHPSATGSGSGTGEPPGSQSPKPTKIFVASSELGGVDPGIAVGNSFVLVSDQHRIGVYNKVGSLIGPKAGQSAFPNPFKAASLFSAVFDDIAPKLNCPSGLPTANGITAMGDVRVLFDPYRKRFWIYAMAKNNYCFPGGDTIDAKAIADNKLIKLARRNKAAVAVSKTEDPRDGFYTFWWNETIHNGDCNDPAGCSDSIFKTSGEGSDYPSIGIAPKYFLATVGVARRDPSFFTDNDETRAQTWLSCKSPFVQEGLTFNWCGPFYSHLMVVDADALAKGCRGKGFPSATCPNGRSYGLFIDAKNYQTDRTEEGLPPDGFAPISARGVKPVVMHPRLRTTIRPADAYFVNNFIDHEARKKIEGSIAGLQSEITHLQELLKKASTPEKPDIAAEIKSKQKEVAKLKLQDAQKTYCYVVVWSLVGDALTPKLYPIKRFTLDHPTDDWRFILNASYRAGRLYATFNECAVGSTNGCLLSVRVVRINSQTGKTEIDRSFGINNKFDDNPSDHFNYRFPGIEANQDGDIVVVYSRYQFAKPQRQEVRYSVWYHDEPDIRPSRRLKDAEAVGAWWTDTAGIAVDPSDKTAIWMAHTFAAAGGSGTGVARIAVGRVLGKP